jgi:hypothetical protein
MEQSQKRFRYLKISEIKIPLPNKTKNKEMKNYNKNGIEELISLI